MNAPVITGLLVGHIARRDAGSAPRWALYRVDGTLSNSFGAGDGRETVIEILARNGLVVRADDSVVSP